MNDIPMFSCIIPTLASDYTEVSRHLYSLFDMIQISKIVFIGPENLGNLVYQDSLKTGLNTRIDFVNENDIIPFDKVKYAYDKRLKEITGDKGTLERISRTGWYYQQFLKMEYHRICQEEYYLCWDADTIPLRHIDMFHSSGKPFLDIKPEYRVSYFNTIRNLLGYNKLIQESFVSEHMLFNTKLMSELINDIMSTSLKGNTFYERIFNAIDTPVNGFSEFETYGTWIANKHPDSYRLRHWKSLRNTGFMINRNELTEEDLKWLATGFDAASFERYQETEPELTELFRNQRYRNKMTVDVFYNELLEMGLFGEFKNGGLIKDDCIFPI